MPSTRINPITDSVGSSRSHSLCGSVRFGYLLGCGGSADRFHHNSTPNSDTGSRRTRVYLAITSVSGVTSRSWIRRRIIVPDRGMATIREKMGHIAAARTPTIWPPRTPFRKSFIINNTASGFVQGFWPGPSVCSILADDMLTD